MTVLFSRSSLTLTTQNILHFAKLQCLQYSTSRSLSHSGEGASPPPKSTKSGAGFGNVRDRVIPTSQKAGPKLFQHTQHPLTCSLIGAPMTYGRTSSLRHLCLYEGNKTK